jgi:hypothetical protein
VRLLLLFCAALLSLTACNPLRHVFAPSPAQALEKFAAQHPELTRVDTVTVRDTVVVAKVEVHTRFVALPNPVREQRDSLQLDSLLNKVSASLDTAQRKAAQFSLHRLIRARPIFPDTLCFDTLGVHGRIWQRGNVYSIRLTRDAIRTPHEAKAAFQRLTPCTCKSPIWYDPRTWPYLWLLAGFAAGIVLCLRLRR